MNGMKNFNSSCINFYKNAISIWNRIKNENLSY